MFDGWGGVAEGVLGLCGIIGSAVVRSHNSRIEKIEGIQGLTNADLQNFKLDAEKRFAKDETLQSTIARLHDKMEEHSDAVERKMDAVQTDIKSILQRLPR